MTQWVPMLLCAAAGVAQAQATPPTTPATAQQVGHQPESSPFKDLEYRQEFALLVGNYHAHRDPAFVGPQSGLIVGGRYAWRASGPVHLTAEVSHISSDRRLVNPARVGDARELGTESRPLWSLDGGLAMGLTGGKTWHHLVPEIAAGVGLITDFKSKPDTGGFRFGTKFALTFGGGIRYVPTGQHWGIRADMKNRAYSLSYPETFYQVPTGGTAVAAADQARSFWMNNPTYTLGLSYFW